MFWVDVGSQEAARSGFMAVAQAHGIGWAGDSNVDQAVQALANNRQDWLLILDNADDVDIDYSRYIPSGSLGTILITSRNPECSLYSTPAGLAVELPSLDDNHSRQLLLKAAKVREEDWQAREVEAQDVVDLLGSHTLGLIQAGAYVAQGFCRLDQYRAEFEQRRKRLLQTHPKQASSRYGSVYATFEISAKVLEGSGDDEADQDALDLLKVLCMLHSSVLWLDIFAHAWDGARWISQSGRIQEEQVNEQVNEQDVVASGLRHISEPSQLPGFINMDAVKWDDYRVKAASNRLQSLSLVTQHTVGDAIGLSMHPLAHAWAKERLQKGERRQAWITTGCVIALSYHFLSGQDWWLVHLRELQPHILPFVPLVADVQEILSLGAPNAVLVILLQCGSILNSMQQYTRLEELLEGIYYCFGISPSAPSTKLIIKHPQLISMLWILAGRNLVDTGRSREAIELLLILEAVILDETHPSHPTRLTWQRELAIAYYYNAQPQEAIELLTKVVKTQETTLHETHPDQLASQSELARAYCNNGQAQEAIELLRKVVKIQDTTLHETHPSRLTSLHVLASAFWDNKQTHEAVELMEHVVEMQRITLAEDDSIRLVAEELLAVMQTNIASRQP